MSKNTISTRFDNFDEKHCRLKQQCENISIAGIPNKTSNSRPALRPINPNITVERVQPFRVTKQKVITKGFFSFNTVPSNKQPAQSFKIFDENSLKESKPQKINFDNAYTELATSLATLPILSLPFVQLETHDISLHPADPTLNEETVNIINIDDMSDIYCFSEYAVEVFMHLKETEKLNRSKPNYMCKQPLITPTMRSIVVDWLIGLSVHRNFDTETTHLAVNYIDRFLSKIAILPEKIELVGATAMFIALKVEEELHVDVAVLVADNHYTYTKKQMLKMELIMLKVLNFDVVVPTSNQFLKRYLKAAAANLKTEFLAQYLCDLALIENDCTQYLPSMIAASAVCLASFTISGKIWDETMEHYMQYDLNELAPCITRLCRIFKTADFNPQNAIYQKYENVRYDCVSKLKAPISLPFDEMDMDDECG